MDTVRIECTQVIFDFEINFTGYCCKYVTTYDENVVIT